MGDDVNFRNDYGNTALHLAAYKDHAAIVDFLISKGADVNARNVNGDTPLQWLLWFARNSHTATLEILKSASQRLTLGNASDRRSAVIALIAENDALRTRLGIKPGLEFKQDFDVNRLVEMAIGKREASDPNLRADVEAEVEFQIQAAQMLCDDNEFGTSINQFRR